VPMPAAIFGRLAMSLERASAIPVWRRNQPTDGMFRLL
jgi:hypothetical protein